MLAAIFTIIMRPAIRGACPAFVFDSNAPRIGKKKLGDGASIIDGVALFSAKGPDNTSVWYLRPAGIALVG